MHGSFRFVDSHVYDTLEAQGDVQQGRALSDPAVRPWGVGQEDSGNSHGGV